VITTVGTPPHLEAVYVDKLTDLHASTTVSQVIPSQLVPGTAAARRRRRR